MEIRTTSRISGSMPHIFSISFKSCSHLAHVILFQPFIVFLVYTTNYYHYMSHLRSSSIGVWYSVLYSMMLLSMLTNSLIVGFSSEQLAVWCPWMYETIDGDQFIKLGYGRYNFKNALNRLILAQRRYYMDCEPGKSPGGGTQVY